jgi:MerR family transcriptional regulator, thiopeptide resistance regulator
LKQKARAVYRIQEFAKVAGVTVRALHHYDRVGLLTPTARSGAGYRLYQKSDIARLEQIVVLKYLGLPLSRIAEVLRGEVSLSDVLSNLNQVLSSRRRHLSLTMETLGDIEQAAAGGEPNWNAFAALVREAEADKHAALGVKKYCSEEVLKKIRERRQAWTMTLQDYELARDLRAAIARNESPASPAGQALAARWRDTIERFTEGDAEMKSAVTSMVSGWGQWTGGPLTAKMRDFFLEAMRQASTNS